MMTPDEIRLHARSLMEKALGLFKEDAALVQIFFIHTSAGIEIIPVPGFITQSEAGKEIISRLVRRRVQAGGVEAIFMVSDMFLSNNLTKEQFDEIRRRKLNVSEAAAAGLCTRSEAIVVLAESPLLKLSLRQFYSRDPMDPDKVELTGEVEELPPQAQAHGRFTGWFAEGTKQ